MLINIYDVSVFSLGVYARARESPGNPMAILEHVNIIIIIIVQRESQLCLVIFLSFCAYTAQYSVLFSNTDGMSEQ